MNRASLISYACLVFFVSHAYSQQLIYAVAVGETPASFRARFGSKPWPPSWKLQHSIELSKLLRLHCADCLPSSAVWSADGNRLFLTLDLGDEDGIADESQDRPGTYVIAEDGTELGALAAQSGRIQLTGYHRQASIAPYLIGQFSNGNYLFRRRGLHRKLHWSHRQSW